MALLSTSFFVIIFIKSEIIQNSDDDHKTSTKPSANFLYQTLNTQA